MTEEAKQEDLQLTFETAQAILDGNNQPQSRVKQIANERPVAKLLRTLKERDPNFAARLKEKDNLSKKHKSEQEQLRKEQMLEMQELNIKQAETR